MIDRVDPVNLQRVKDIFGADNPVDFDLYREKLEELKGDVSAGLYPVHMAIMAGDVDLLQKLIDLGEDLNEANNDGELPLNLAASSNDPDILNTLIKAGKKLDLNRQVGVDRLTELHILAKANGPDCIKQMQALLKAGAGINVVDDLGKTPLHYAAESKNRDVIKLLLAEGARLDVLDKEGLTPFKDERKNVDLHQGPRMLSAATIDFETVLKAFVSGNPPVAKVNRLGEIEVVLNNRTYNLSKILEHKPDFEHIRLYGNLSKEELKQREKVAINFFREVTTYRYTPDNSVHLEDRENMFIYEINMRSHPKRNSDIGEMQVEASKTGLKCILYGKAKTIIPWDKLPGVPQDFKSSTVITKHINTILSALNEIDTSILSEPEARALRYYTMASNSNHAFRKVNQFMRDNGMIENLTASDLQSIMFTIAYVPEAITHLRDHYKQNENQPPTKQELYRGETYSTKKAADTIVGKRTAADITTDSGFVSTSTQQEVTQDFKDPNDERTNLAIQFSQPENAYGVDVSAYSDGTHESEVLIMPGTQIIFRHSPYADNGLIAVPVRSIDEIYTDSYHPNIMNLRGDIINLVDQYANSPDPNKSMHWISTMDEFCKDLAKYEAGGLYHQAHACKKCLEALDKLPPDIKASESYQKIRSKVTAISQTVNEAINISIDQYYNQRENPQSSSFIEAAQHAYDNHLKKAFTDLDICGDDPMLEFDEMTIHRPNHGLAHSIRTALYVPAICSALQTHANSDNFVNFTSSMTDAEKYLIQLAMIFYVTGRRSEASWKDSPEAVKSYRVAAGENFINYLAKHQSELTKNNMRLALTLNAILSNASYKEEASSDPNPDNTYGLFVLSIIDMAHRLDLLRCYPKKEFGEAIEQSCDQLAKDVDANFIEKAVPVLLKMANDSVAANGDRRLTIFHDGKLLDGTDETMTYDESFVDASTNPEACIKQCLTANPVYFELHDGKLNIDMQEKKIKLTPLQEATLNGDEDEINRIIGSPGFDDQSYQAFLGKVVDAFEHPDQTKFDALIHLVQTEKNLNPGDMAVALHIAIDQKQEDIALALIAKGADLNFTNDRGETPLFVAAKRNLVQVIQELNKLSNTINTQDDVGHSPLTAAASRRSWEAVVELLNTPKIDISGATGSIVLCLAIMNNKEDIAKTVIANISAIDVNMMYEQDKTPLYYAIVKGMTDVANALIMHGAEINSDSQFNDNYLDLAMKNAAWDIVALMIKHPSIDVNNDPNLVNYFLSAAIDKNQPQILQALFDKKVGINIGSNNNKNPVFYAIAKKSPLAKQLITAMMKNVNHPPKSETIWGVITAAINSKNLELMTHAFNEFYGKQGNIDINQVNNNGETLLTLACKAGNIDFIKLVLQHKPDINRSDSYGTPLKVAVANGREDIAELLIQHGANVNELNKNGDSLLSLAAVNEEWEVVRYLLTVPNILVDNDNNGNNDPFLSIFATSFRGPKELFLEIVNDEKHVIANETLTTTLCALSTSSNTRDIKLTDLLNSKRAIDVNQLDKDGNAPIHHAAAASQLENILTLVARGADINAVTAPTSYDGNKTALAKLVEMGRFKMVNALLDIPNISLTIQSPDNSNLLHIACKQGEFEIVEKLLKLRAEGKYDIDINAMNDNEENPLLLAIAGGHEDIVAALIKHNVDVNIATNEDEYSPIELAAVKGLWSIVDMLQLNKELTFNTAELFFLAIQDENYDIAKRLMARDDFTVGFTSSQNQTALKLLINADRFDLVNELLQRPDTPGIATEINTIARDGGSPASDAAEKQQWDVVMKLLSHPEAKINYNDISTLVLLGQACKAERMDIVEYIFKIAPPDPSLLTHVVEEASIRIRDTQLSALTVYLLANGADPNQRNANGDTCLHIAVKNHHLELVKLLLKHGADISITNAAGIHVRATKYISQEIATEIAKAQIAQDRILDSHLVIQSCINNDLATVTNMLADKNNQFSPALLERLLCYAVMNEQNDIINHVLPLLPTINPSLSIDGNLVTSVLVIAASKGNLDLVEELLQRMPGLSVNDLIPRTAIQHALQQDKWNVVLPILQKTIAEDGLDLRLMDLGNLLFKAVAADKPDIATFLINNNNNGGAKYALRLLTSDKLTALELAAQTGSKEVIKVILAQLQLLPIKSDNVTNKALYFACQHEHWDVAKVILNQPSFKFDYSQKYQQSMLVQLAKSGHDEMLKEIFIKFPNYYDANESFLHKIVHIVAVHNEPDYLKLLTIMLASNKSCVNLLDNDNSSPLHIAVHSNNFELVKLLVQNGALLDVKDDTGLKPIDHLPKQERLISPKSLEQRENILKLLTQPAATLSASSHSTIFGGHKPKETPVSPKSTPAKGFGKE